MTDAELRDAAWEEFRRTTVGYLKSDGTTRYPAGPPLTTHWGRGKGLLDQIGLVVPPPSPAFGALLKPRLPESGGNVIPWSTLSELKTALNTAAAGDSLRQTASLDGQGQVLTLDRVATAAGTITLTRAPGATLRNFAQVDVRGAYLRLRGLDIGQATIDGVKIDVSAHHIELDGNEIHHSSRQGINVQPAPRHVQVWSNRIHHNGSAINGNLDHGCYFAYVEGDCVFANNLLYDNYAYGLQAYPQASGLIVVFNTIDGGSTRGGMVIGSNSGLTDGVRVVGLIGTNAPWCAVDTYDPAAGDTDEKVYDSVGFGNGQGDWRAAAGITYENCLHLDPLYIDRSVGNYRLRPESLARGMVDPARYGYVPPFDIEGKPRTSATPGCYA